MYDVGLGGSDDPAGDAPGGSSADDAGTGSSMQLRWEIVERQMSGPGRHYGMASLPSLDGGSASRAPHSVADMPHQ